MRILIYTDLHATEGHERMHNDPTKSLQIYRVNKCYARLFDLYKEFECDALWDLGDTTDDRNALPVPAVDAIGVGLSQFPITDCNIKLIGNHEQFLRNTRVNAGQLFSPYFQVIEQPQVIELNSLVSVICAPYPESDADLLQWLDKQKATLSGKKTILIGHFQISGCWSDGGQLLDGVTLDSVSWINMGLLGHIHRPQTMGNCTYIGSPFQQNWGEAGERKRVAILDVGRNGSIGVQYVDLDGFPEYREIGLKDLTAACEPGDRDEDRLRVILRSPEEASEFYAHKCANRAEPKYMFDVYDNAQPVDESQPKVTAWTPEAIMERYMHHNPPSNLGINIDSGEMLQFGKDIYAS